MTRLKNEVAIITGGAGDIGSAHVESFVREGANVIIADINEEKGNLIAKKNSSFSSENKVKYVHLNSTDEESWKKLSSKTIEEFGKISILVNCYGTNFREKFINQNLENWNTILNVNLTSVFIGIKELIPFFKLSGKGSIINIGSLASLKGSASSPAYTASKTGLIGLTKSTAVAFAKDKIRCNLVCPGHVDTNFIRNDSDYSPNDWNTSINNPENYNQRLSQIPLGRLQTPKDIANLSTFLASEDSNMITGGIIAVDGGVTI
jgi:NAD(P)-dependent dehydrogenase (short-subunit alcohol dehydrogenase family)|tara:strand:- start:1330 stop:2118 length:789 start_codon:yes stop_codon:yes gene_type:complete